MNQAKIKKVVFIILKSVAIMYLTILIAMFFSQEKLLFHPTKTPLTYEYNFEMPFEEKWTVLEGLKIHSLYFKAPEHKGVILYFHGNGCNLSQCGFIADQMTKKTGWDVWIVDYPGYGKSEGQIKSENQLHVIADIVLKEVGELNPKKIVIYGRSLGTGIATRLVSKNRTMPFDKAYDITSSSSDLGDVSINSSSQIIHELNSNIILSGLVLETPYFSIEDLALSKYPFVPAFLLKYHFKSDQWIKKVESPILMFHGSQDQLIPILQAKRLSQLTKDLTFVEIPEGTHDDLSSYAQYWQSLMLFLEKI